MKPLPCYRLQRKYWLIGRQCIDVFSCVVRSPHTPPPPDEHRSAGQHRDVELGPSAPLHQDLPGSSGTAGVSRLPEPPEARPPHLDLQPQRHPDGPRRQGAPLHGLTQIRIFQLSSCSHMTNLVLFLGFLLSSLKSCRMNSPNGHFSLKLSEADSKGLGLVLNAFHLNIWNDPTAVLLEK